MYIGGIASGLDTEALITQMLAIERRPMVHMQQRKDLLSQQRDAWRDINTRLNSLRERMGALRDGSLFHGRAATSSAPEFVSAVAGPEAVSGRYEIKVTQLATAHRVASDEAKKVADPTESLGYEGVAIINLAEDEAVQITVTAAHSLADIADEINNEVAGVSAMIVDGQLVLRANETGRAIEFQDDDGVWDDLGILVDGAIARELTAAQSAQFEIEGVAVTRTSNVVDDLIDGVTFTLHGEGTAEVTVETDRDGVVSAVKEFVDQYNSVYSFMQRSQQANADAGQRGVLSGDGMVMRISSQLRNGIMGSVSGAQHGYNNLMSVGISIDRYGTMTLDESKLRSALDDNAEAVEQLFGATQDENNFDGVAVRLENTFQSWLSQDVGLLAERQKMFGNQMRDIDRSMERLERRLEMREASLMRQMTALETMLAGFQDQAMWLDGQLQQLNAMSGGGGRR